jgi:hypothetical protein
MSGTKGLPPLNGREPASGQTRAPEDWFTQNRRLDRPRSARRQAQLVLHALFNDDGHFVGLEVARA